MNKVAKASINLAKSSAILTGWATAVVAIGLLKTVQAGSKAALTVRRRYKKGKKIERITNNANKNS